MYYESITDENGVTYTIDMLRFSAYIPKAECKLLRFFLDSLVPTRVWTSNGFGKYSLNWSFGLIWAGLGVKQKNESSLVLFSFEFNPNKLDSHSWYIVYEILNHFSCKFRVTRFDLACDLPFNINDLKILSLNKSTFSIFYHDHNDKTYYYGRGNGHTKIYNKKIESDLDCELTRIEVTKECNFILGTDFELFSFGFPEISFQDFTYDKSMGTNETLDTIQFALNNGYCFKSLSRRYRSYFRKQIAFKGQLRDDLGNKILYITLNHILRLSD